MRRRRCTTAPGNRPSFKIDRKDGEPKERERHPDEREIERRWRAGVLALMRDQRSAPRPKRATTFPFLSHEGQNRRRR